MATPKMGGKNTRKNGESMGKPTENGKKYWYLQCFVTKGKKKGIGEKPQKKMGKVWDNISADLKMRSENMDTTGKIWENET
jgi:hypothetical protein